MSHFGNIGHFAFCCFMWTVWTWVWQAHLLNSSLPQTCTIIDRVDLTVKNSVKICFSDLISCIPDKFFPLSTPQNEHLFCDTPTSNACVSWRDIGHISKIQNTPSLHVSWSCAQLTSQTWLQHSCIYRIEKMSHCAPSWCGHNKDSFWETPRRSVDRPRCKHPPWKKHRLTKTCPNSSFKIKN